MEVDGEGGNESESERTADDDEESFEFNGKNLFVDARGLQDMSMTHSPS